MYKDIGGYDEENDEFKEMCHKALKEKFNYHINHMTRKLMVNIVFSTKAKTHT